MRIAVVAVVCLAAFLSRADGCCQPDAYSASYDMKVDGKIPIGDPRGPKKQITATGTVTGQMDWTTKNGASFANAKVIVPVSEDMTMNLDVTAHCGLLTENGETKLFLKAAVPMMGITRCMYFNIIGDFPDSYQCPLNLAKSLGKNEYTSANPNPMVKEFYKTDDNCVTVQQKLSVNIPGQAKLNMEITAKDVKLEASGIDNEVPTDCMLAGETPLPPLTKGGPSETQTMMGLAMHSQGGPQKRSLHHMVLEDIAKRSLDAMIKKRSAQAAAQIKRFARDVKRSFANL